MLVQVAELVGKKLLYQTGTYDLNSYANLAAHMGMEIRGNGGHDERFAEQFRQIKVDAGLMCVLYPDDGEKLLALPENIYTKLVVLRTRTALGYSGMADIYGLIEDKGIKMVFEEWQEGWLENFTSTLVRAVYSR